MRFKTREEDELFEGEDVSPVDQEEEHGTEEDTLMQPDSSTEDIFPGTEADTEEASASTPSGFSLTHPARPVVCRDSGSAAAAAILDNGLVRVLSSNSKPKEVSWDVFQKEYTDVTGRPFEDIAALREWKLDQPLEQTAQSTPPGLNGRTPAQGPAGSGTGSLLGGMVASILQKIRSASEPAPEKTRTDLGEKIALNRNTYQFNKAFQHTTKLKENLIAADCLLDTINDDFQLKFLAKQLAQSDSEADSASIKQEYLETFFGSESSDAARETGENIHKLFDLVKDIEHQAEHTIRWNKMAETDISNISEMYQTFSNKLQNSPAAELMAKPDGQSLAEAAEGLQKWVTDLINRIVHHLIPSGTEHTSPSSPSM